MSTFLELISSLRFVHNYVNLHICLIVFLTILVCWLIRRRCSLKLDWGTLRHAGAWGGEVRRVAGSSSIHSLYVPRFNSFILKGKMGNEEIRGG